MTASPSESLSLPYEVVKRFPANASQDVKRTFAQTLIAALDKLLVKPAGGFVVMREEDYDDLIEAQRDELQILREELECEKDLNMEARELIEMVEDMERGMRTPDEIIERVTRG